MQALFQHFYLDTLLQNQKNIKEIRYQGLMIGIDLAFPCNEVRNRLVKEYKMLTGNASTPNTLRVLPALNVKKEDVKKHLSKKDRQILRYKTFLTNISSAMYIYFQMNYKTYKLLSSI